MEINERTPYSSKQPGMSMLKKYILLIELANLRTLFKNSLLFYYYLGFQQPKRAFKRKAVQQYIPHQSFPGKEQCFDVPSSHMNQSSVIENNQEPSDFPVKRCKISGNDSDSVTQLQKESSILTTTYPNRSSYCTPATVPETSRSSPRCLDPSSQTNKITTFMEKTVPKNQESSPCIIVPQQTNSCPNTCPVSALSPIPKGQEIVRLSEKRPLVKNSLSENAWNYENRQFSPVTVSTTNSNPVEVSSTDTMAVKQQCVKYSVSSYKEAQSKLNPNYNQKIPDEGQDPNLTPNANADLYLSMVSGTFATSQMTPEYLVSHQYPLYQHPDYTSGSAVPNIAAPAYIGPADEKTMNNDMASLGISTNGTYFVNTNSAQTSCIVNQSPQVYHPFPAFQDPVTLKTFYSCHAYNQAPHTDQIPPDVTFKPALEQVVYQLPSWLQVSPTLT